MEEKTKRGFYEQAARAGWVLPIVALAVMILAQGAITKPEGAASAFIVAGLLLVLLLGGLIFGILGFFRGKKDGKRPVSGLIGACASLAILVLVGYISANSFQEQRQQQSKESRIERLRAMVEQANKQLPLMVDDNTRADSLAVLGPDLLGYNYTFLDAEKKDFDAEGFSADILPQLLSNYLTNPNFKPFRESGLSIRYTYYDKNGEALASVVVPEPGVE